MELFAINRFTLKQENEEKKENEILEKLQRKVKKAKRRRVEENEKKLPIESTVDEPSPINDLTEEKIDFSPSLEIAAENEKNGDLLQSDELNGFEILGQNNVTKVGKNSIVLPGWLARPEVVPIAIATAHQSIDREGDLSTIPYLTPYVRKALKELNINRLFPIQKAVIPWILDAHSKPPPFRPRDLCVSMPTGSGKTLSFAIPIVQLLANRVQRKIRALVILPVAELAVQVFRVFKKLCEQTDLSACLLSKQTPLHVEQTKLIDLYKGEYYSKVDILITTPGRLVEHLHSTKGFCLKSLQFLIIDEADRIMSDVFQNWLHHLNAQIRVTSTHLLARTAPLCYSELELTHSKTPHKLLFSATLSKDPEKLQYLELFQPKLFTSSADNVNAFENFADVSSKLETDVGEQFSRYTVPAELTEKYCLTECRLKPLTLFALIMEHKWSRFLCFTNSAQSSGRLSFVLNKLFGNRVKVGELSASLNAKERSKMLSSFIRGKINGLVCTDALARGIDIPQVDIVISYDPPRHIKTYIHRIGRTARAGRPGTAITLLNQKEWSDFNQILKESGKGITDELLAPINIETTHANEYSAALTALRAKITTNSRLRILQKERMKEKALLATTDTAGMTLMEKLQVQATVQVHNKAPSKSSLLSEKKNPSKMFKRRKQKE
uniref:ATP-dependent RNA helicase n=1 Tax=Glossina palpalis gambiensis TaxID=67801 RepID=A0A1B0C2P6_9MUSC